MQSAGQHNARIFKEEGREDLLENVDLIKMTQVLQKSLVWMVLIMIACISGAYIFIRYTKPMFESASELKLDIKSEATVFGFNGYEENLNNLSGEKELLLSRMFHSQVVDAVKMDISYYAYGNVLYDERYRNSPFSVGYTVKNPAAWDVSFDIELINDQQFAFIDPAQPVPGYRLYRYGETVETPSLDFAVHLTDEYSNDMTDRKYFFRINSVETQLNYIRDNMNVEYLNLNAKTIRISFKDHNKYKARDMVQAIDTLYLKYSYEAKKQATLQKIKFLNEQLESTEKRLEDFEDYFENFTIDNKTVDLKTDLSKTISQLEALDTLRYETTSQLMRLDAVRESILNDEPYLVSPIDKTRYPVEMISDLENLNNLLKEKELLLSSYKENTFAVRKKVREIELLRNKALDLIDLSKNQLTARMKDLNDQKRRLERDFIGLPSKETEYNKTSRYYTLYEDFYLSLMQRKTEFEIAQAGTVTDFMILSPAALPYAPIYPPKAIVFGIGIIAGLMLSGLLVIIRYLLHNKITSLAEVERLASTPSLGIVPLYRKVNGENQLIVTPASKSAISEALRTIRTNMDFINPAVEKKVISVTSTISGEGKTFIAINLGGIIACSHSRVVIVDLDMRKPRVGEAFNAEHGNKGVSSLLIGKYELDQCVFPTEIPNLKYIPSGPVPPNPSELLMSASFSELLENLKSSFDVIILDTPPIGLVTDGVIAMKKADLPVYVFRANYSKRIFIKTLNRLAKVNNFHNIAVILNAVRSSGRNGYGYGYYYSESGYYEDAPKRKRLKMPSLR